MSAVGIGVAVAVIKGEEANLAPIPDNPRDEKSTNMERFIELLETEPDFDKYAST